MGVVMDFSFLQDIEKFDKPGTSEMPVTSSFSE